MERSSRHRDPTHYLNSSSFLRTQSIVRSSRTLHLDIKGVEPRSKKGMRDGEKLNFQLAVLRYLEQHRKRAFRSPLAVRLWLETADQNPAHIHTIAKNLLDLLARPVRDLRTRRRALAYHDDAQVSVLSVTCSHGRTAPGIFAKVSPLSDLLVPLAMAWDARKLHDDDCWDDNQRLGTASERLSEIRADEAWLRRKYGNAKYEALEAFARQSLQDPLLGRCGLTVSDIATMFNASSLFRVGDLTGPL